MAAGFAVRTDDLRAAAAAFARLRADAEGLLATSALGDTGGMAGRDPVLAAWRARYDALAVVEWAAATTAVATLGAIATKLAGTADTYVVAEHDAAARLAADGAAEQAKEHSTGAGGGGQSLPDGSGAPSPGAGPADGPGAGDVGRAGGPPSGGPGAGASSGAGGPAGGPGGNGPPSSTGPGGPDVPDALAPYYPGGDPERLRAAAAQWGALAEGMSRIAGAGDDTFRRLVTTGDGVAFSAMRTFWARQFTPCATDPLFNAVVNGAGVLRDSCRELAALIEHTRASAMAAAAEAVADMEPLELPARLLGKLAWNIPELELLVGMGALALAYLNHYRDAYLFSLDRLVERLAVDDEQRLRRAAATPDAELADGGQIAWLALTGTAWDTAAGPHPTPDALHLTPQRITHILTGDRHGGGHVSGAGVAGKTEFPARWDERQITAAVLSIARAPDTVARSRIPGRWEATGVRAGVRIRVIVGDDGYVVTAVPLSGPGVVRNPS